MKKEPVDIILLTYQRINYLKEIIDEIKNRTSYPYRLIVIDNGSTDGSREWIKEMYDNKKIWKYIFTDRNLFMTEAYNEGLKLVESKYFIATQDDVCPPMVEPCWLIRLVNLMDRQNEYMAITINYKNKSFFKYLRKKYGKISYKRRKGNGKSKNTKSK